MSTCIEARSYICGVRSTILATRPPRRPPSDRLKLLPKKILDDISLLLAPNTECPYGGYYYSGNNHCYQLYETSVIWTDAASACEALANHSQLAVMDSQNLATFVINNVFGT